MEKIDYLVKKCKKCDLHITRNNTVLGEGSLNAVIMFIGEAPGRQEDLAGRPFVGRAGRIFDELLDYIGLSRDDVYISNIIKCRPPNNRNPLNVEIEICSKYLDKQIDIIKPEIIVALGKFASSYIFKKFDLKFEGISRNHGKIYSINSTFGKLKIIPIYHPAASIYNKKIKNQLFADFKIINQNL